ncbi:pilus assembly protein TadG-related protein [Streptomyces thermoviolaceus]|uniref:Putative Flp pilus-assembly TadG-like N-terminal domain-containing protein n=1 Tax=Streptomyces thermoviolaceus subsp. thermoviolaceus TaxID=66860 RepID=A0ABX0YY65_STRTL|nr:pilus assembly protein TadG-related protein [Streptomyces thermoviolaceus]MCM3262852.1 pilus assembly protein TadG-related protein [Streptomyces thermoviolaceus]NJP15950.1 hypothetical protein [Streptomyces thermoviolaceus subsp. thermoviolaceus]GHA96980.1 hypothetical protein GCM10010512_30710 [Streptomyces thermoviolaceus subsp. thermoviolaceus]
MRRRRLSDGGQAFPIYITVVAGLLFLAVAYFAVGQAAVNRSSAQTAADAAALAAAQETRDQLAGEWVKDVLDPTKWKDIFEGKAPGLRSPCWRASQLAQWNDAHLLACDADGLLSYTVEVQTNKSMGKSLVPITSTKRSKARATVVIEPLCTFQGLPESDHDRLPRLFCKKIWDLDPKHLTDLPEPKDLFGVRLVD